MIKYKYIYLAVLVFTFFSVNSQDNGHGFITTNDIPGSSLLSPQSFGFTEQGNQKVSLFTGKSGTTIPVYTYQDKDFYMPIFLEYNMSGFIPNQREGIVGLGWHLNAGGAITRIVNGRPDEAKGEPGSLNYIPHGHYYGIKNSYSIKTKSLQSIFDLSAGTVNLQWYWNVGDCEVNPDLFSFSMPGFSGRFYIQNNGDVKCDGNKPFKVDLSGFNTQYMDGNPEDDINDSEIKIKTDDGYTYVFGGNIQYLGVLYSINNEDEVYDPVITTWYLKSIGAPSGRELTLSYLFFDEGIRIDEDPDDDYHYLYNINHVRNQNADSYYFYPGDFLSTSAIGGQSAVEQYYTATKIAYLDSIKTDNIQIDFGYQEKEKPFYQSSTYQNDEFNQKTYKLTSIKVYNTEDKMIKNFSFSQAYYGGTGTERLFLTSFGEVMLSKYHFTYYNTSNLPNPLTAGIDHWGYWNNYTSIIGSNIPTLTFSSNGDVTITGTERNTSTSKYNIAMLETITYPTKGTTTFYYEPHDYSQRLERRNDFDFKTKLYSVSGICGGARIKKVVDNDGENNTVTREYKYVTDYVAGGTTSSGILMDWPRYAFYWEQTIPGYSTIKHLKARSSSYNRNYSGNENYIQYSETTVVSYPDNGCTTYEFTDYVSNPNENAYNSVVLDNTVYPTISNVHLWNSYVGIKFNDKSFERGIPRKVSYYRKEGSNYYRIKTNETTLFTGATDFPNRYLVGVHGTGGIAQSFKIYYYPFLPKQTVETTYDKFGNNPITVTTNKLYNNNGYLRYEDVSQSEGSTLQKTIKYISDYNSSLDNFATLSSNNILKLPIKIVEEHNGTSQVSGKINLYTNDGKIRKIYRYENSALTDAATHNSSILIPSFYNLNLTVDYNASTKNAKQTTPENNFSTVYLWGYGANYPVARIDNISYSNISPSVIFNIENHIFTATDSFSDVQTDVSYLQQQLATYINNSNYKVTLYTYEPQVGMTSQTDPTGVTTFYEYDVFGRLASVKNDDGKLLKKFNYHYAN
jgi:YD repeat-containing protein